MTKTRVMVAGIVATVALAACGGNSAPIDLGRELDRATGDSMGLAPVRGGTQFVSAIEQTQGSTPAAAAPVKRPTPSPKAVPQPVKAPIAAAPARVAEAVIEAPAPAPTPAPAAIPAPVPTPSSIPTPTPHRRGGYSTMGDIMRNAPFPINPVAARRLEE